MLPGASRKRSVKIEEMLEGFIKTFSEYSLDKTTIQKLAKEMDMTPSLIYIYFENKDDIIFKCTQYHHEKIQAGIIQALQADFKDGKTASAENTLAYVDSTLMICSFLLQVMAHPKYYSAMEESKFAIDRCMLQFTDKLTHRYEISKEEAAGVTLLINSMINDYVLKKSKDRFYTQFNGVLELLEKQKKNS